MITFFHILKKLKCVPTEVYVCKALPQTFNYNSFCFSKFKSYMCNLHMLYGTVTQVAK